MLMYNLMTRPWRRAKLQMWQPSRPKYGARVYYARKKRPDSTLKNMFMLFTRIPLTTINDSQRVFIS